MKNHSPLNCLRVLICLMHVLGLVALAALTTGNIQAATVPLNTGGVYWGTDYYDPDVTVAPQFDKDPVTGASPAWTVGGSGGTRLVTNNALRVDTTGAAANLVLRQTTHWDASQQATIEFRLRVVQQTGTGSAGSVLFANGVKWQNMAVGASQVLFAGTSALSGDFTQWTTFRITLLNMSTAPEAKLYINGNPAAVRTTNSFNSSTINYLQFGDGSTGSNEGGIVEWDYIRWTNIDAIAPGQIKPSHPFLYCSSQLKYSLFQNYLDWWIDRPLFFDRTLRYPTGTFQYFTTESFRRDMEIMKNYKVDGLMAIGNYAGGLSLYQQALNNIQTIPITKILTSPRFTMSPPLSAGFTTDCDNLLKAALASPTSWRLNGKVLVSTYCGDAKTPQDISTLLSSLRTLNGDTFLFVVDLAQQFTSMLSDYNKGLLTPAKIETVKTNIRSYLNVCDGIAIAPASFKRPAPYYYDQRFNNDFYVNILIPTVQSVFAEPAYANKLLGMDAAVGYINRESGVNHSMEGTKRLRRTLETATSVKPDFIFFDEWNEVNENTCIQPTVQGTLASERIIRYYSQKMKCQALTPLAGDDLNVANLILSYRRVLKIGEALELELVNIPDGVIHDNIQVQLSLKNMSGGIVATYSQLNWDAAVLNEQTYTVSTESLTDAILIPSLSVTYKGQTKTYENFHYIEVKPTWNQDYITVRQTLRDLLIPVSFSLEPTGPAGDPTLGVPLNAQLNSTEELSSVEILENRNEVCAYDSANEFNTANNVVFHGQIQSKTAMTVTGKIYVNNVSSFYFRAAERPCVSYTGYTVQADGIQVNQYASVTPSDFFIAIPRNEVANGTLDLVLNGGRVTVLTQDLNQNGLYSKTFPNRFIVTLCKYKKLPDIPVPVGGNTVNFNCTVYPESPNPTYHMRGITRSGKVFHSYPIQPFTFNSGSSTSLNIFSETDQIVKTVSIGANLIPDINYAISNTCGDVLTAAAGSFWSGFLGAGFSYGEPMLNDTTYPPGATNSKPALVSDGGVPCLSFDGLGNYLNFPQEMFPRGSFSLIFEIKPTSTNNQVLFRHYGQYVSSMMIKISNQQLVANFLDSDSVTTTFATGLSIPVNTWSKVQVDYNQQTIKFRVNNGTPVSYTFSKRALYFGEGIFGGLLMSFSGIDSSDHYFQGLLKSFRVMHNAQP